MQTTNSLGPSITQTDQGYVEGLLEKVFSALPSERGVVPSDMLDTYLLALIGQPINAFRSVVYKLLTGVLDPAIRFVPRPPELANYVRAEASRLRLANAPKSLPAPPQPSALVRMQNRWANIAPIATGLSLEQFNHERRHGRLPVGAVFVAMLGNVYASAHPDDQPNEAKAASRTIALLREKREQDERAFYRQVEIDTEEQRDHWRTIAGFKDRPNITAEQAVFRGKVETQLGDQ